MLSWLGSQRTAGISPLEGPCEMFSCARSVPAGFSSLAGVPQTALGMEAGVDNSLLRLYIRS